MGSSAGNWVRFVFFWLLLGANWVRFAECGVGVPARRQRYRDWVRFVYLDRGPGVGAKLGRFRIFEVGAVQGLGSFRIIPPDRSGEILNPKLEPGAPGRKKPEIRNMQVET